MTILKRGRPRRDRGRKAGTSLTFDKGDLEALGQAVALGTALTNVKHPVFARLRAAMTKMGVAAPKGI